MSWRKWPVRLCPLNRWGWCKLKRDGVCLLEVVLTTCWLLWGKWNKVSKSEPRIAPTRKEATSLVIWAKGNRWLIRVVAVALGKVNGFQRHLERWILLIGNWMWKVAQATRWMVVPFPNWGALEKQVWGGEAMSLNLDGSGCVPIGNQEEKFWAGRSSRRSQYKWGN